MTDKQKLTTPPILGQVPEQDGPALLRAAAKEIREDWNGAGYGEHSGFMLATADLLEAVGHQWTHMPDTRYDRAIKVAREDLGPDALLDIAVRNAKSGGQS